MAENNNEITYFGETDFRNKRTPFGIKSSDRSRHMYIIGKTGMGKSTLLENLAVQDIKNGKGIAFIDPHGNSAEFLLNHVPKERIKDVIYFAPHDIEYPVSFNVMEDVGKDQRHLVANGLMGSFKKIWPDVWSARMEYISMNIILALLEYPGANLLGINRMLSDKDYRKKVVDNVTDPSVKSFWLNEFAKYSEKIMVEAGASIQNKFGQFSSNPLIRNIIGQNTSSFSIRDVMDGKKIFIANLSKGRMGEINTNLIGGMLITKMYLGAMSRASSSSEELKKLPNFYLYVDEFQSFVNDSFADILSEARKYKLNLIIAHQYIEQMPEAVRNAVFGNVGTTITFRVGPFDAEVLEKVFAPKFTAEDIVNLGFAQIYLSLMIDGVGSSPFSAKTLPPIPLPEEKFVQEIIEQSRFTYAKPRDEVEAEIRKWHEAEPAKVFEKKEAPIGIDKTAVKSELENIKKDYGLKEFPPKKSGFVSRSGDFRNQSNRDSVRNTAGDMRKTTITTADTIKVAPVSPGSVKTEPFKFVAPASLNALKTEPIRVSPPSDSAAKTTAPSSLNILKTEPALKARPLSLNSLKNSSTEDKKSTGKNMADLKSILSVAMSSKGKEFSVGKIETKIESPVFEEKETIIEEVEKTEIKQEFKPESRNTEKVLEKTTSTSSDEKKEDKTIPKEVPESVLRKVLEAK